MKLYILRHAEAHGGYPDSMRKLTDYGKESTEKLARFLKTKKTFRIDEIHHSTLVRAGQTAKIFGHTLGSAVPLKEIQGLEPEDDIDSIIPELERQAGNLLIVGHNPHLTELVSKLMTGSINYGFLVFKKSSMVCLQRYTSRAPLSQPQVYWTLRWMLLPKLLP